MRSVIGTIAMAFAASAASAQVYSVQPTSDADTLASVMRRVATSPTDTTALVTAGELSLKVGDLAGAAALFARADKIDPRIPRVKAGIATLLLRSERPGEALRFFAQAESYGMQAQVIAAERGLAYDLIGHQERAQRDYRVALRGRTDDETTRRYALSLGISGKRDLALEQLDPLVRRGDRAAWRSRAFVLAMAGDIAEASRIATTMMPPGMATGLAGFFRQLPALSPSDRAFAVHFGETRPTPARLADARLAPVLAPLAPEPGPPVALAAAPVPLTPAVARDDRRSRRARRERERRDRAAPVALAAVSVAPAPPRADLPAPPAYRPNQAPPVALAALDPRLQAQARPAPVSVQSGAGGWSRVTPGSGAASAPSPLRSAATTSGRSSVPPEYRNPLVIAPSVAADRSPPAPPTAIVSVPAATLPSAQVAATTTPPVALTSTSPPTAQAGPATIAAEPAALSVALSPVRPSTATPSGQRAATPEPLAAVGPATVAVAPMPPSSPPAPPGARPDVAPAVSLAAPTAGSTGSSAVVSVVGLDGSVSPARASPATSGATGPLLAGIDPAPASAGVLPGPGFSTVPAEQAVSVVRAAAAIPVPLPTPAATPPSPRAESGATPGLAGASVVAMPVATAPVPTAPVALASAPANVPARLDAVGSESLAGRNVASAPSPDPAPVATPPVAAAANTITPPGPGPGAGDSILARIVANITIPAAELGVVAPPRAAPLAAERPSVAAAEPAPSGRAGSEKALADRKADADKKRAADKVAADKKAADKKVSADKKAAADKKALAERQAAEKAAKADAPRIWVQVSGGANEADLSKAWSAARAKAPALAGRQGWSTPLRATNRVLTGPFKTDAEARSFVNQLAKQGLSAFPFTSTAGQKITRLPTR